MSRFPCQNPDHEALSRLAREDPQAFEELRQQLVGDLIGRAPAALQPRLHGLQFRIDAIRHRAGHPLGATVKIYQLMWQSFMQLHHELTVFRAPVAAPRQSARVFEFRPKKQLSVR